MEQLAMDPDDSDWDGDEDWENEAGVIPYFIIQDPDFVSTWETAFEHPELPVQDPVECPEIAFWNLNSNNALDEDIYASIRRYYRHFRTHYLYPRPTQDVFCFRIPLFSSVTVPLLRHWLRLVYLTQSSAFKVDFSFSFLLVKREDAVEEGEQSDEGSEQESRIRAFISSSHSLTFFLARGPPLIANQASLDELVIDRLIDDDLHNNCLLLREDTKWEFLTFLGVSIYVTHTDHAIGGRPHVRRVIDVGGFPEYIVRNGALHLLWKEGRATETDGLCFFRGLAIWETKDRRFYENQAKERFERFVDFVRSLHEAGELAELPDYAKRFRSLIENVRKFSGVQEKELGWCERLFFINVQIWCLESIVDKRNEVLWKASVIRYPAKQYSSERTLHLLRYADHFCLILDLNKFAHRYECSACDRLFCTRWLFSQHWQRGCEMGEAKKCLPGGSAGRKTTLWDDLSIYCGITVAPSFRFYPYRVTWDIETYGSLADFEAADDACDATEPIKCRFTRYSWFREHDYEAHRPVRGAGETRTEEFIRVRWNEFRSDRSELGVWRVRTCRYEDGAEPFPLTTVEIIHWLIWALCRVSVERKLDGVRVDVSFLFCGEDQHNERLRVVRSKKWFLEMLGGSELELTDYDRAERLLRAKLMGEGGENLLDHWDDIIAELEEQGRWRYRGLLAFECTYSCSSLYKRDEMIPLSITVVSNVPGFEQPAFFLNDDLDDWFSEEAAKRLTDRFLEYCVNVSVKAEKMMRVRMHSFLGRVRRCVREARRDCADYASVMDDKRAGELDRDETVQDALRGRGYNEDEIRHMRSGFALWKLFCGIHQRLRSFCQQLIVIGFNSGRFDVPVLRNVLLPALYEMHKKDGSTATGSDEGPIQLLVHNQRYISITTPRLRFLDALNYTSPMTYDTFLKAWGVANIEKLKFPYDAVCCPEDLRKQGIPPRRLWANWLHGGKRVTDEEWCEIEEQWRAKGFANLEDCLRMYNEADCTGLLLAAGKIHDFWRETYGMDSFVDAVSLPGLAWESLMKNISPFTILALPNKKHSDAQLDGMKSALIAGPSIIFTRYAAAGETTVPSGDPVSSIQGFDVNSLYSYCYTLDMPALVPGLRYRPKREAEEGDASGESATFVDEEEDSFGSGESTILEEEDDSSATTTGETETTLEEDSSAEEEGDSTSSMDSDASGDLEGSFVEEEQGDSSWSVESTEEEDETTSMTTSYGSDSSSDESPPSLLEAVVDSAQERESRSTSTAMPALEDQCENVRERQQKELESTELISQPTESYWRGQTEWLAWSTEHEFRASGMCSQHEPLGRYFNGKEVRIGGCPVDGICPWCCTIQQFQGCVWHCHENCLNPRVGSGGGMLRLAEEEVTKRRERTRRVQEVLESARRWNPRIKIVSMWECQWDKNKKENAFIRHYVRKKFPYYPKARSVTAAELIDRVSKGKWTGFVTIDCQIRPDYWAHYQRFPTLFFHRTVQQADLKGVMLEYAQKHGLLKRPQRVLVSGMRVEKWTVLTPYLKDLINNRHVEVTKVYEATWYPLSPVFRDFFQTLQEQRRLAQQQGNSGRSLALKLNANAIYGRSCMNRDTQTSSVIVDAETAVAKYVNNPRFRQLQVLQEGKYYQICRTKSRIVYDVPYQLAVSCLNYAKMSMISFVWDFIMKFMNTSCRLCFMDTDSVYVALKGRTLEESLDDPQRDREAFELAKRDFLHDSTPGKLKLELKNGTSYVGLAAKAYTIRKADGGRVIKAKGVQKATRAEQLGFEQYERALKRKETIYVQNRGFQMIRRPEELAKRLHMYKYSVRKKGLTFFYQKRHLSSTDPYDTVPLEMDP